MKKTFLALCMPAILLLMIPAVLFFFSESKQDAKAATAAQWWQPIPIWTTATPLTATQVFGPFYALETSCFYGVHQITSFTGTDPTWHVDLKLLSSNDTYGYIEGMAAQTTTSGTIALQYCDNQRVDSSQIGSAVQIDVPVPAIFYLRFVIGGTDTPTLTSNFTLYPVPN